MQKKIKARVMLLSIFLLLAGLLSGCTEKPPTPPEGYFPEMIGEYKLKSEPSYGDTISTDCQCQFFRRTYIRDNIQASYFLRIYKSPDDAKAAFEKFKSKPAYSEAIFKQSDSEILAITKLTGSGSAYYLGGSNIIYVSGKKTATVAVANNLPYQTLGLTRKPELKTEDFAETPATVNEIQETFNKNKDEAYKKYSSNYVLLKVNVASFGDNIQERTETVKTPTPTPTPKRRSTKYSGSLINDIANDLRNLSQSGKPSPTKTPPKTQKVTTHQPYVVVNIPAEDGGEPLKIWCYFEVSEKDKILKLQEGAEIFLRGMVYFKDGKVVVEKALLKDQSYNQ